MVRDAVARDVDWLVELAAHKREAYKSHAPVFHRPHPEARERHGPFLASLVADDEKIVLVSEENGEITGFVVAALVPAPPVYEPGGLTCLIDDFAVARPELWEEAGRALLDEARARARSRGAAQTVVVCGPLDEPKRAMLEGAGHVVVSEWWTAPLN
ncbi:MAG: GNAT family N-acetyltransferase [Gaiellaceae bacterium]